MLEDKPVYATDYQTISNVWQKKLSEDDSRKVYLEFRNENFKRPIIVQHAYAHIFSEALYKKERLESVGICTDDFDYACFHIVFADAIQDYGPDVIQTLDQRCIASFGKDATPCFHGIGHGLQAFYGTNELLQSLKQCDKLSWKGEYGGCRSGVFMEYNLNTIHNAEGRRKKMRAFDQKVAYTPCSTLPDQYHPSCYFALPNWWFFQLGNISSFPKLFSYCDGISNNKDREACFYGVGYMAATSSNFNVQQTRSFCSTSLTRKGENYCLIEATEVFSENTLNPHKYNAVSICNNESEEVKKLCREVL